MALVRKCDVCEEEINKFLGIFRLRTFSIVGIRDLDICNECIARISREAKKERKQNTEGGHDDE